VSGVDPIQTYILLTQRAQRRQVRKEKSNNQGNFIELKPITLCGLCVEKKVYFTSAPGRLPAIVQVLRNDLVEFPVTAS
jgi:hypothetical protein